MKRLTALTIITLTLGLIQLNAQNVRAHIFFGTNLTEASLTESGKSQVGFRMGLNTGLGVSMKVDKRLEMGMELLYSQNGLYVKFNQLPAVALDKITLHYFEVPLFISYPLNNSQKDHVGDSKNRISGGIAYARLFNHKIIDVEGMEVTDDLLFNQNSALLFNVTATSFFSKSFAFDGRVTISTIGDLTFALRILYAI